LNLRQNVQQLANVQNSLYSVIENSKKQQWTITNYVILVYAAIFGLSRALKPLGIMERRVFGSLVAVAGFMQPGCFFKFNGTFEGIESS
jgi:hypothetical protein